MKPETITLESVDHSERAHAEFGPSSLKYVHLCAGYHGRDGTSAASEKGTRIHEALEVRDPAALHDEEEFDIYSKIIKEEDELIAAVLGDRTYMAYREIRLTVELDAATPTFGTCDLFLESGDVALMIDYKTGISKIDPPLQNWQAKAYALAAFQRFKHINEIHFAFIVPLREEDLTGTFKREDMDQLRKEISEVIRKAETTRPKWDAGTMDIDDLNPTVNCRYCRHEDHCPALGAVCIEIAKRYRPDLLPAGTIVASEVEDPANVERLFVVAKIVEGWVSSTKNRATCMAIDGVEFENHKLRSMGSLKKTVEKNYLAQLAIRHGLELTEVIEAADLTLGQLSDVIHTKAPRGKKAIFVDAFQQEAIDMGIVEVGPKRYTLTQK